MFHYKGEKMAVASSNSDLHGNGEAIRRELAERIPRRRLKVLDVGTGFGINAAFLAKHLPAGSEIWTVDPSKEVLAKVEKELGKDAARVRFLEASADDMGFPDGRFDAVVSVMVLHHIEGLRPALKEMARVLRPGGVMVLVDYKPEASHELEFKTRHEEKDFFPPAAVVAGLRRVGMEARAGHHGVWYLIEARKPSAARGSVRARPARRPRAAG
jgi:ubiquinone/menaquinone biosynthesis C-methylase UbiE